MEKTNLMNPNSGTDAIRIDDIFLIVYNLDKDWREGRLSVYWSFTKSALNFKTHNHLLEMSQSQIIVLICFG